jgi:hypothetical protein
MLSSHKAIIVLCLTMMSAVLYAQEGVPPADSVFQGNNITDFQWSPDGGKVIIADAGRSAGQWTEVEYSLTTQQSRPSSDVQITQSLDLLDASTANDFLAESVTSLIYPSPDRQWAAYPVVEGDQEYLALYHVKTNQVRILYDAPLLTPSSGSFEVHWSENGSAFYVYDTNGPVTYWYYIGNFVGDLDETYVLGLHEEESLFRRTVRGFRGVFDIDTEGNRLLIGRVVRTQDASSGLIMQLLDLDIKTFSFSVFAESPRSIAAASYGQQGQFFYISIEGMFVYDANKQASQLLNADINSSWIRDVEISPDGRYVAATEGGDSKNLYIIPTGLK